MSRSKKSFKNLYTALIGQSVGLVISFIARIIFINYLGAEYLGLNGLFTNILSVLSLAELGIGEAITFSLYKPLSTNDIYKCQMLMQLYKKVYTIIGVIIFAVGICITPFLQFLIAELPDIKNIHFIYILFVFNSAVSYLFSYKRNLIIADQNRYIVTIYRYVFYFILNVLQIIFLIFTKNYIIFLLLQISSTIIENIFISRKANIMYSFLKDKNKIPLDLESKNQIVKNTKAMIMHKIGGIIVNSTDNIILSKFVSIASVGFYSNYYLIINALNTVYGQVFSSLTASVGNLYVTESKKKTYDIFKKIYFLNFFIYSISSICLIILFNKFIILWLGKKYLFSMDIVLILVINFYVSGMRKSVLTFKESAGLFYNDRWKAIVEGFVNLVASLILVKIYGIFGVFLGTFISSIFVCVWIEPYVLYKYGFNENVMSYFKQYFKYLVFTVVVGFICFYIIINFSISNAFLDFLASAFFTLIFSFSFIVIIFHKCDEFEFYYNKVLSFIKKYIKV